MEINGIVLLSMKDLATKLSITERTVYQYIKDGKLKAKKIGGSWYVTNENLEKFIKGE
ncbi:MAG: helix-turn-helix domain-containing protein [Patescibacteria group bacterium]